MRVEPSSPVMTELNVKNITEPVYQTLIISKLQLHGTSLSPLIKKKEKKLGL